MNKTALPFIGRTEELALLREQPWHNKAQLMIVYGRRRVGKTQLITTAFSNQPVMHFDGLEGEDERAQIISVLEGIRRFTGDEYDITEFDSWYPVFDYLDRVIQAQKRSPKKPLILFFDEFQWLSQMKTHFVSLFKYFWDNLLSKHEHLKVILCGSISSFMVKNVMRSKALYGRIDRELKIEALSLPQIAEFYQPKLSHREVLDIALCFGGIPRYLEIIQPKQSLIQNINELALNRHGYFYNEFQRIFLSHFGKIPIYQKIVRELFGKTLTYQELAKQCKVATGGTFSEHLEELVLAGFIERFSPVDKNSQTSKLIKYRLYDEYLSLYHQLIAPNIDAISSGEAQARVLLNSQKFKQWRGYAFERLCRKHSKLIADALKFSGIGYRSGSWFASSKAKLEIRNAQIDLLFVRDDQVITSCEVKYVKALQASKIIDEVKRKTEALEMVFPSYTVENVLIVAGGPKIPANLEKHFDHILFAEDVFF